MPNRYVDWLKEAEAELGAARDLLASQHYSWCCFTCQQAAEKALKGALEKLAALAFGHNLNDLRKEVEKHVVVPRNTTEACARLNRFYIPTRYPNAFPSGAPVEQFFEADAQQALQDAEEVLSFVRAIK